MTHKHCSSPSCGEEPIIRVQPFKALTWDYWCQACWVYLCLRTVKAAHDSGYLTVEGLELPKLTLVDSDHHAKV